MTMTRREKEIKDRLEYEIQWNKNLLLTIKKPKHRAEIEHQIRQKEYELALGIFDPDKIREFKRQNKL